MHGTKNVFFAAYQPAINRITGYSLSRVRHHRQASELFLMLVVSPGHRQHNVREESISSEDDQANRKGNPQATRFHRTFRQRFMSLTALRNPDEECYPC